MPAKMTLPSWLLFAIVFIASGVLADPSRRLNPTRPKAFDYAADAERVVGELHHNFSCDGREYGYYADQGQQCQVFHICMPVKTATGRILDTFQFSFFCPNQTRFSQDSRTCINEAQAYPCHKAHTLYDLNKAIGHKPNKKKRPVNLKDSIQGNFKTNSLVTQSASVPSSGRRANTPAGLKESFDDTSVALDHFDESSVGLAVQEGVTPVHADSTVAIGAPAVAIPPSAENAGTTTSFAGRFHSPSTTAPPVDEFVSNNLSDNLEAPELVVPPGSQIISTKSLQHQNSLPRPANTNQVRNPLNVHAKASTINVSTHGSSGLSSSGISSQAPILTSSSFLTTTSPSTTTPVTPFIESTTPQTSFTNNVGFSRVTSANQANLRNNGVTTVPATNRGNGLTSTESSLSFRPIPQRSSASFIGAANANGGNTITVASHENANRFSNSHTLEAASLSNTGTSTSSSTRGQISTFASRARAHVQNQASQSNGQSSQSFSFSQNVGNDRGITSQPVITAKPFVTSTPQPFISTQNAIPALSLQFTPPPINQATVGVSRPLQIPGFSAGSVNKISGAQQTQEQIFTNQEPSTLSSFPTTTEYYADGEFPTTVITDAPFESTRAVIENSNRHTQSQQNVVNSPNRGVTQKVTVQRRPIQRPSVSHVSDIATNAQRPSQKAENINSINLLSNSNRATTISSQDLHEQHRRITPSLSSGINNNQGIDTPSSFIHSVSSQRTPVPSRSTTISQANNILSLDGEQVRISSQTRAEETQRDSHSGSTEVPNSPFRGSTTSRLSSTGTRNNHLTSSRGLRAQTTTTGTENKSQVVTQLSSTVGVNRGTVNRTPSHSGDVTSQKTSLNDVTSNRGPPRESIIRNTTRRPVNRNRGSKKFQPSQFLLQSAGFIGSQWQSTQSHNAPARSSISRSRSRSQSENTGSSIHTISINHANDENDSQDTVVNTSFDNARIISSSEISHKPVSGNEISKQGNNIVLKDNSKESLSITPTTIRPVTQIFTQSTSRGRTFGSQVSSNNFLSSQQSRSRQSSYGVSASTTESSLSSQYGNSQTVPQSQTVSSITVTPASRHLITTSAITTTPNPLKQTAAPHSFSRTTSRVATSTLSGNSQDSAARKVIKKKIIVNGRPGSRKSQEPTVSIPKTEPLPETQDEEEKKRQRALDALARFSPGFANANLLAFRLIPNGAKKKSTSQVSTTETTVQQTSTPQNAFNSRRRGSSRARITTTPKPIITTAQTAQPRSRTSSRRLSRPVTQKSLSAPSTTTVPTVTTQSPFTRLRSNSRGVVNKHDKDLKESTELQQDTESVSISTQTRGHNRGNTKFTHSLNNNRRRIIKKVTPLSGNSASSKNTDSTVPSSVAQSTSTPSEHTPTLSVAKQSSQTLTHTGQLRVVGTSIESSVSSNLQTKKSESHASSSQSSTSSSLSKSRSNSRSRSSSSISSKNTGNLIAKQKAAHQPLTDLELEALSAIAQVNSAFSNAAKTQQQHVSSSRITNSAASTRRRNSSRSRSRSL